MVQRPVVVPVVLSLVACGVLALGARAGRAQTDPSLREQLAELRSDRPAGVPRGVVTSIAYHLDVADRIAGRHPDKASVWRRRAAGYLEAARKGRDPYIHEHGKITNRAYHSPTSTIPSGYAIYIPPDYDPSKSYPLYIALHGGSSNGNLFLGVVLGNNMPWEHYKQHLYDQYKPRWKPDWIVVAPTGFGQIMWRWMGERDVLDVIADVRHHYSVDPDRIVLGGLSNGGVGAYAMGLRHAWRFSAVQAMAGAPSWILYAGGERRLRAPEELAMRPWSGLALAENSVNTEFRYYHGRQDGGPMKPRFVRSFTKRLQSLGLEPNVTWYDTGHDVLYLVHRHGRVYESLAELTRDPRPRKVRLITGDYRANRQHWVSITRFEEYPELARVRGEVSNDDTVELETGNVRALALHIRRVPLEGKSVRIEIDGDEAYEGRIDPLGHRLHFLRSEGEWEIGFPTTPDDEPVKRPGLSGPITDAYYERMVHVYGTQNEDHTETLKRAAEKGADGWPLWLWHFQQPVMADREVTPAEMERSHLVLYGTPGDNAILERIAGRLPIRVDDQAVHVGDQRHEGRDIGVRFIYPNPLAPDRYVIVQAGTTMEAVRDGHRLPDFLPDYLVYDAETTRRRSRLATGRGEAVDMGWFDRHWALAGDAHPSEAGKTNDTRDNGTDDENPPDPSAGGSPSKGEEDSPQGGGPEAGPSRASRLEVPPVPAKPSRPKRFRAPASDPAGHAARRIARRVQGFENFREKTPGAKWRTDEEFIWRIRPRQQCLQALDKAGVPARPHPARKAHPVPAPVELLGPVDGVWFRSTHTDRPLVMSCELAARLPALARVLRRHGVRGVDVMSALRDQPFTSFHTMGLGLDLQRLWTQHGWLSVQRDFHATPDHRTCEAPAPDDARARRLLRIACAIYDTNRFSTVLTPNYNEGHRHHLHLDARPADPRLFLR